MIAFASLWVPLLLFLITTAFGFWVSRAGRPYHSVLFNFHKLVALVGVVLAALRVKTNFPVEGHHGWLITLLAGAGISSVMLFITGAVMSIREDEPGLARFFHRAGSVMILICLVLYSFFIRRG